MGVDNSRLYNIQISNEVSFVGKNAQTTRTTSLLISPTRVSLKNEQGKSNNYFFGFSGQQTTRAHNIKNTQVLIIPYIVYSPTFELLEIHFNILENKRFFQPAHFSLLDKAAKICTNTTSMRKNRRFGMFPVRSGHGPSKSLHCLTHEIVARSC
jgi:hypothetical protein